MVPFVTPFGVFLLLAALRRTRRFSYSLTDAAAWSLASMLVLTGTAHFSGGMREDMIRMVPPLFPRPELIVSVTGVLELIGALGLLIRRTRSLAGMLLALLFVSMFPANVHAARQGLTLGGAPVTPLWLRLPQQIVFIAMALAPAWGEWRSRVRTARDEGASEEAGEPESLPRCSHDAWRGCMH